MGRSRALNCIISLLRLLDSVYTVDWSAWSEAGVNSAHCSFCYQCIKGGQLCVLESLVGQFWIYCGFKNVAKNILCAFLRSRSTSSTVDMVARPAATTYGLCCGKPAEQPAIRCWNVWCLGLPRTKCLPQSALWWPWCACTSHTVGVINVEDKKKLF